jgi:Family of unknown function (DUF6325)
MTAPREALGPVEWLALAFPGPALDRSLVPVLAGLVDSGTVRLIDAAVLHKAADGTVTGAELEDEDGADFGRVDGDVLELLNDDDLTQIAVALDVDTTTLVLVWENRWATALGQAVADAGGTVVAHDRVPRASIERALAAAAEPVTT